MEPDDTWSLVTGEDNGNPSTFRIRKNAPPFAPMVAYPHLLVTSWPFERGNEDGLPSSDVGAHMGEYEDTLESALESADQGFLAAVVTGNGIREWLWYVHDWQEVMKLVNEALCGNPAFRVQVKLQSDPRWDRYTGLLDIVGPQHTKDVYLGLRHQALSMSREELGIPAPYGQTPGWGVLMDLGLQEGTATVFALADGTTSLYVSLGGGIIGGGTHEAVRHTNERFIEAANLVIEYLKPTRYCFLPAVGQVFFYVLTDNGILTGSATQHELTGAPHPLARLFFAGDDVVSQLRMVPGAENFGR